MTLEINNLDEENIIGILKLQNKANILNQKMILKKIIGLH